MRFVDYFLKSPQCIAWLRSQLQGSVTLKINLEHSGGLPGPTPAMAEQERSRRSSAPSTTRSTATAGSRRPWRRQRRTLFRARFVDFVGVDEFEESEIGRDSVWMASRRTDRPREVRQRQGVHEVCEWLAGVRSSASGSSIDGVGDRTPRSDIEADDDFVAGFDDILFAWSGSLGVVPLVGRRVADQPAHLQGDPRGLARRGSCSRGSRSTWRRFGPSRATRRPRWGTFSVGIWTRRCFRCRRQVRSPRPMLSSLRCDQQRAALVRESDTLVLVRDALLPRLISGQIRVPDTADPVEVIEPATESCSGVMTPLGSRLRTRSRSSPRSRGYVMSTDGCHVHGAELAPDAPRRERRLWSDVVLVERLRPAVARINPHLPAEAVQRVCDLALTSTSPCGDRGSPRVPRSAALGSAGVLRRPRRGSSGTSTHGWSTSTSRATTSSWRSTS